MGFEISARGYAKSTFSERIISITLIYKAQIVESDARAGQMSGGAWPHHLGGTHQERTEKGANFCDISVFCILTLLVLIEFLDK